jgi:hypothetical protein
MNLHYTHSCRKFLMTFYNSSPWLFARTISTPGSCPTYQISQSNRSYWTTICKLFFQIGLTQNKYSHVPLIIHSKFQPGTNSKARNYSFPITSGLGLQAFGFCRIGSPNRFLKQKRFSSKLWTNIFSLALNTVFDLILKTFFPRRM